VQERDLLHQPRQPDADARRERPRQGRAGPLDVPRPHGRGQRGGREQVEGQFQLRTVAIQIRIGREQNEPEGGDRPAGRARQPPAEPPHQRDVQEHQRQRQQADRPFVRAADPDRERIQGIPARRLVLGEVAVEHVARDDPASHVRIRRLVAVQRLRLAPHDGPRRPPDRGLHVRPEGVPAPPERQEQEQRERQPVAQPACGGRHDGAPAAGVSGGRTTRRGR
jgi:hypothetical protein